MGRKDFGEPGASAVYSLTHTQIDFIYTLPKAELHAHLNGSIPIQMLHILAAEYLSGTGINTDLSDVVIAGLIKLSQEAEFNDISEFFSLFPAIYAITETPPALARATRAVLQYFLDGKIPHCHYLELRTTPRESPLMSRERYIDTVLREMEFHSSRGSALIMSLDRRMTDKVARECLAIAIKFRKMGRRLIGIDLCGDPTVRDSLCKVS